MSPLVVTTPNTMMWTGCLVLITLVHFVGTKQLNGCSVNSLSDLGRNFSLRKTKACSVGEGR